MLQETRPHRPTTDLRAWREVLGLRLEDLAERTGFAISYLSRIETGERRLTLPIAAKLLDALRQGARSGDAR